MINFFRKIRKKLADTNKPLKYARYAIGEIFLVVFGILIALSINNWNEWKKERVKEREILIDLVENLEINIKAIESHIKSLYALDKSSDIIMSTIYNKRPYVDSLAQHFHRARIPKSKLYLAKTGYNELKTNGLHIMTNKELKGEIVNLFEIIEPNFLSNHEMINELYIDFDNHVVQNFIYKGSKLEPVNYQTLLTDHFYISWIRAYHEGRKSLIVIGDKLLLETRRVLQIIRDELK